MQLNHRGPEESHVMGKTLLPDPTGVDDVESWNADVKVPSVPNHVWFTIFGHLLQFDRARAALTCKEFYALASETARRSSISTKFTEDTLGNIGIGAHEDFAVHPKLPNIIAVYGRARMRFYDMKRRTPIEVVMDPDKFDTYPPYSDLERIQFSPSGAFMTVVSLDLDILRLFHVSFSGNYRNVDLKFLAGISIQTPRYGTLRTEVRTLFGNDERTLQVSVFSPQIQAVPMFRYSRVQMFSMRLPSSEDLSTGNLSVKNVHKAAWTVPIQANDRHPSRFMHLEGLVLLSAGKNTGLGTQPLQPRSLKYVLFHSGSSDLGGAVVSSLPIKRFYNAAASSSSRHVIFISYRDSLDDSPFIRDVIFWDWHRKEKTKELRLVVSERSGDVNILHSADMRFTIFVTLAYTEDGRGVDWTMMDSGSLEVIEVRARSVFPDPGMESRICLSSDGQLIAFLYSHQVLIFETAYGRKVADWKSEEGFWGCYNRKCKLGSDENGPVVVFLDDDDPNYVHVYRSGNSQES